MDTVFLDEDRKVPDVADRALTRAAAGIKVIGRQEAAIVVSLGGLGMLLMCDVVTAEEIAAQVTARPDLQTRGDVFHRAGLFPKDALRKALGDRNRKKQNGSKTAWTTKQPAWSRAWSTLLCSTPMTNGYTHKRGDEVVTDMPYHG